MHRFFSKTVKDERQQQQEQKEQIHFESHSVICPKAIMPSSHGFYCIFPPNEFTQKVYLEEKDIESLERVITCYTINLNSRTGVKEDRSKEPLYQIAKEIPKGKHGKRCLSKRMFQEYQRDLNEICDTTKHKNLMGC